MHRFRRFFADNKFNFVSGLVLTVSMFLGGCSKAQNANEGADRNTNSANVNQAALPPVLQSTLTGDIERIAMSLATVRDSVNRKNWSDANTQLQSTRRQVDAAGVRQSRLSAEFEALKAAIDRAMTAVEARSKDAEDRVAELQTRIGAIKVMNAN